MSPHADTARLLVAEANLLGHAPAFMQARALIRRFADCDAPALIEGETGTGKELAARAMHHLSERRHEPFVPVNCGAIPETLLEAELFGHERGAFTDARNTKRGLVDAAGRGTLFLDEVEALSPRAQVVLLRFLQDHSFRAVGAVQERMSAARVVAASNVDLNALVGRGALRGDLLYRLRVLHLRMPALRERREDIAELAQAFIDRFAQQRGRAAPRLDAASLAWMLQHPWPGNVRELESLVLRAVVLCDGPVLSLQPTDAPALPPPAAAEDAPFATAKASAIADFERGYLTALLQRSGGNMCLAARLAQQDRGSLRRLVKRHGLAPSQFRNR